MNIARTAGELQNILTGIKKSGKKIGFVPTMGALHTGHMYLISKAKEITDYTVASIFVNPVQFNDPEDLKSYPRTIESDIDLLTDYKCDLLFLPEESEIYPDGYASIDTDPELSLGHLNEVMEALYRPGHFRGVMAVVYRLFEIVKPDSAFFGEKDYQQLLIIKELTKKYFPNIQIVAVPTIREADGLALSSRNVRLSADLRAQASEIYKGLVEVQKFVRRKGELWNPEECEEIFVRHLKKFAPALNLEYFLIADQRSLITADKSTPPAELRAFAAVYVNNIRLIDNLKLF